MSDMWDRNLRRVGPEAIKRLAGATVAIIGLGSLGGDCAFLLASSGVGKFVLFDPDVLEEHNVPRHICGLNDVGRPKVEAVSDIIRNRNPAVSILAVQGDVLKKSDALAGINLALVCGLGSEISQQKVGAMLLAREIPALVGGVYEKGIGGEVLYVDGKEGPCYACFSSYLREAITQPKSKYEYGMLPDEVKAEPGLGIHVMRIAIVQADWAIRLLVNDQSVFPAHPGNMVILSNERMPLGERQGQLVYLEPFSSYWGTIEKLSECRICGNQASEDEGLTVDQLNA